MVHPTDVGDVGGCKKQHWAVSILTARGQYNCNITVQLLLAGSTKIEKNIC